MDEEDEIEPIRGQCFCGSVCFEFDPPSDFCSHCHCESCRRSHAAAFVTWTSVATERFRLVDLHDTLKSYNSSPAIAWMFCSNCGASILYEDSAKPWVVYIAVASLIDPLDREPDSHVSYEEHLPWLEPSHELPRYVGKSEEVWVEKTGDGRQE